MGEQSFCLQLALFQLAGNIWSRKNEGTHLKEAEEDVGWEGPSHTWMVLDPHCLSSWLATTSLWRNENPSSNQTELDLNFALSLSPGASYITSLSLNFLGVWEGGDHKPIKNANVLSHCEAGFWKQTLTRATHLLWKHFTWLSGNQHGKLEWCRHGRRVSSGDQIQLMRSGYLKYSVEKKGREAQWETVLQPISNVCHGHGKVGLR